MARLGFHASHELYSPSELLRFARLAQEAGFHEGMCSDHYFPWSSSQKHSGYAWSWLGAALATTDMSWGTVCAPGQRYHPAIIAQAAATLAEMFPGRLWFAAGTGQYLNEHITGDEWPSKAVRRQRLRESVDAMRRLWRGEIVTCDGLIRMTEARVWSLPAEPPQVFGAAITEETAEWVGGWADGLMTVGADSERLRQVIAAFRRGGGAGKPVYLQAAMAVGETDEAAIGQAFKNWGVATLTIEENQNLATPADFDAALAKHSPREMADKLRISTSLDEQIDRLRQDFDLGVDTAFIHNVGGDMERFIGSLAEHVLPEFAN